MVFPIIIKEWSENSIVPNCRTGLVNTFMFKASICIKSMSNVRIIYNWSQFLNICHVSFVSGLNLAALHNQMMEIWSWSELTLPKIWRLGVALQNQLVLQHRQGRAGEENLIKIKCWNIPWENLFLWSLC